MGGRGGGRETGGKEGRIGGREGWEGGEGWRFERRKEKGGERPDVKLIPIIFAKLKRCIF